MPLLTWALVLVLLATFDWVVAHVPCEVAMEVVPFPAAVPFNPLTVLEQTAALSMH